MDLLIHVGLHKTGTSTAQMALDQCAEELAGHGILYPRSGLHYYQHSLFPRCLIAADRPQAGRADGVAAGSGEAEPEASLEQLFEALHAEIEQRSPALVILSSEVFTEAIAAAPELMALLARLAAPFERTTLLLSRRNSEKQALSYLRHRLRADFEAEVIDPVGSFVAIQQEIATAQRFWSACGYPLEQIFLEDNSGQLVDHYFGALIEACSPEARAVLRRTSLLEDHGSESMNADALPPLVYALFLLLGNRSDSAALRSAPLLELIQEACAAAPDSCGVSVNTLLSYLHQLAASPPAREGAAAPISSSRKRAALLAAGLSRRQVSELERIARRVRARALPRRFPGRALLRRWRRQG